MKPKRIEHKVTTAQAPTAATAQAPTAATAQAPTVATEVATADIEAEIAEAILSTLDFRVHESVLRSLMGYLKNMKVDGMTTIEPVERGSGVKLESSEKLNLDQHHSLIVGMYPGRNALGFLVLRESWQAWCQRTMAYILRQDRNMIPSDLCVTEIVVHSMAISFFNASRGGEKACIAGAQACTLGKTMHLFKAGIYAPDRDRENTGTNVWKY